MNWQGPAFPVIFEHSDGQAVSEHFGMDLRDYMAAKALPPCMYLCVNDTLAEGETRVQMYARKAYEVADAMLAASTSGVQGTFTEQENDRG